MFQEKINQIFSNDIHKVFWWCFCFSLKCGKESHIFHKIPLSSSSKSSTQSYHTNWPMPLLGRYLRKMKTCLYKNLYTNSEPHFCSNQKVEITQCPSVNDWINKIWFIHIMEYHLTMEWYIDTYYNMNEPWKYYAKWKKLDTRQNIYMKYPE